MGGDPEQGQSAYSGSGAGARGRVVTRIHGGDFLCSLRLPTFIFGAGSRTRGRGTFVSAKVPKAIPPERGSPWTATALRASLAAESGREAFPAPRPVSRESPGCTSCASARSMLRAPRLTAGAPPSLAAPLRAYLARSSARLALRVQDQELRRRAYLILSSPLGLFSLPIPLRGVHSD